jgi:DNA modification methylase
MRDYEWVTAFAGKQYKFVRRLSHADRKAWGYSGIWKINTVRANDKHPAMFPVELPRRCILMHSDEGGIVMEPFNGSGTTIVACENTGRRCRAIEIDPKYVAVALQRYVDAFGKHPERVE